jgi:O-antigen/teichoic acid export membrane protein
MVLARLLTPVEIGKFSIGIAILAVVHMVRDFGVGAYIVQAKELTKSNMQAVFGINLLMAWIMGGALYLSRNLIADFYNEPALADIMGWMSFNFVIIPFSSMIFPLLRREMKFHLLFYINLSATLISSGVSVYFAYHGYGFMSLVWGSLSNIATGVIVATCFRPKASFVMPSLKGARHILSFGGKVSFNNIIGEIGDNAAELVIAKTLGFTSVALFSKAQTVINMFSLQFLGAVRNVYFPVIARQHRDNKPLNFAFSSSTDHITVIAFSFYGFIALYAEDIILIMFGDQWGMSAEILKILTVGGVLHSIWSFAPVTMYALGQPGRVAKAQTTIQFFRVCAIVPAAFISLQMVAWVQVASFSVGLLIYLYQMARLINLNIGLFFLRTLLPNILIAGFSLAIPFCIKYYYYLGTKMADFIVLLTLSALAFAFSWLILLFLTKKPLAYQIAQVVSRKP